MLSFAALQDATIAVSDRGLHAELRAGRRDPAIHRSANATARPPRATRWSSPIHDCRPDRPLDRPLLALPGARDEASAIARLAPRQSVVTLQGELADRGVGAGQGERQARDSLRDACDRQRRRAVLVVPRAGTTDATPNHDGTLTAQEIYGLQLQADLVVLSACRSGGGKLTGDGMATFARAFMYAGTPSMITSVWDVADESSARLVPEFYRVWRGGTSKARALRAAQLTFLKNLRAGTLKVDTAAGQVVLPEHPALWAGFMLIGEPD